MKIIELPNGTHAQVANYIQQDILEYQRNPFIEALPPIFSQQEVIDQLSVYPPFHSEERFLADYKKLHLLSRVMHYFQPLPVHLHIQSSIDRLLRAGYMSRNPLSRAHAKDYVDNWINIQHHKFENTAIQTSQTLSIIGVSGVGKTRTVQKILETIPQVISHTSYDGKPLNQYQITHLTIQTPFDGSVKTIIFDFFLQFDLLTGTKYFEKYVNSRLSTSQLMPIMAQIAKNVGVIVIDELQHLKGVKSKNSIQLLNFFTTLINQVKIPLIIIGTPKSIDILQSQFRQARRSTNAGNILWDRMKKDEIWDLFIEGLWKYQWTREPVNFSDEFSSILYDESQGIADIAVKLFMMVQLRAISDGEESITPDLIRRVSKEELQMVQPMLQALRSNNIQRLADYDDITFPNIEAYIQREVIQLEDKDVLGSLKNSIERQEVQSKVVEDAISRLSLLGISNDVARETVLNLYSKGIVGLREILEEAYRVIKATSPTSQIENDLREVVTCGKENGLNAYEALQGAGIIRQEY
ncbi:AAA family ATPase [Jeotgalibacillus sp. JSM ZJ347]|uniref:AAA family ATPase n=1 Tax=Jeotgalibacillus sp. JSM ZJ347 TaxID=3342117 RepID=UPI0035A92212